jgi:hypothetical protein
MLYQASFIVIVFLALMLASSYQPKKFFFSISFPSINHQINQLVNGILGSWHPLNIRTVAV